MMDDLPVPVKGGGFQECKTNRSYSCFHLKKRFLIEYILKYSIESTHEAVYVQKTIDPDYESQGKSAFEYKAARPTSPLPCM
jgi:hypothetical protein